MIEHAPTEDDLDRVVDDMHLDMCVGIRRERGGEERHHARLEPA